MLKMRGRKRLEAIAKITDYVPAADLPDEWKAAVLASKVAEVRESQDESLWPCLMKMMMPGGIAEEECPAFVAETPSLQSLPALNSVERSKFLTKVLIVDSLIPWLASGGRDCSKVRRWCQLLVQNFEGLQLACPVLSATCEEVTMAAVCMLALTDPNYTHASTNQAVISVMESRVGCKWLLRNAISQSAYYKDLEKQFRGHASGEKSLGPDLQELQKSLQGDVDHEVLRKGVRHLGTYRDAMRPGKTSEMERLLGASLEAQLHKASAERSSESLLSLQEILKVAVKVPTTPGLQQAGISNEHFVALEKTCSETLKALFQDAALADLTAALDKLVEASSLNNPFFVSGVSVSKAEDRKRSSPPM